MRRMSGFDADMLYAERGPWHMHVSALMILDPHQAARGFGYDELRRMVGHQSQILEPMRERMIEVPFGLDRPLWVKDPDFSVDAHLHRIAVPPPGTDRELATLVGDLIGFKLDRGRPLWEMWYIEGLEDGLVAILSKVHHAALDGVAGAAVMGALFSPQPTEPPLLAEEPDPTEGEPIPSDLRLVARGLVRLAQTPLRALEPAKKTLASVRDLLQRRNSADWGAPAMPFTAPRTLLNRPVSGRRNFACTSVPLGAVKAVKNATGVKVNDVVLALCAGALRNWLMKNDDLPDEPLIAACPVSTRDETSLGDWGNMVSGLFATLATDVEDPLERLDAIRQGTEDAKSMYASGIEDVVIDWAEVPVPAFLGMGVRFWQRVDLARRVRPIFNLLISNVPGPPFPLYAAGARLVGCFPMGPVLDSIGLNVTVLSYTDHVGFGFVGCPESVPDIWTLADGVPDALEELQAAVL